ncbi:iojap-like protein [Thermocrinis albus DSM 14484]|uniref:Ribosomal silencing factor RsfS n=1 Tax=Thermocrinis albus (strain DSM 14484 / JCM 11386 / HI 11/12) TaxID=638303 RepID=D3SLN3_THEAH|nr:ribosome silencing factor [Thermocrinis albus]ADC89663.1 iojap-like protein [Thermocrinis albus DSM 14484]
MKDLLLKIKKLLEDKKAEDIVILDVSSLTNLADYFVIATANSPTHARALADYLVEELEKMGIRPDHVEGLDYANWILVDLIDIIVHIFQKEWREYYDLEWLYSTAKRWEE